ncbi:hypothetical protein NJD71_13505, partial [Psychrobacter sp. PP-21]|uniref:Ig-like domain-containing protein n=1 Tax=Psychrobacter sp. PP-21 TaxID=2957503 RepID=UPI0029A8E2C3
VVVDGEGSWNVDADTGAISFTPEAGFTADPTPISYSVEDINGLVSNDATVTIDYPQTAPVAQNDVDTGDSGETVVVDVVANDTDAEEDLDPTTVIITQSPAGGTIAADGKSVVVDGEGSWNVDADTGAISFTPEAGFTADPTPISYSVEDINGLVSNDATVTIDYPQTAPVAQNDVDTGDSGETVVVDVVANDTDAEEDLDPTTVIITQSPAGGTIAADGKSVVVDGEGSWNVDADTGAISFTPEAGFTADPTPISYSVEDINGLVSNDATVTIDYPQTAPVAIPEVESINEDVTLIDNVLTNDTDAEGGLLIVQSATVDVNGSGDQVALELGVATTITDDNGDAIGDLTLSADGSY